MNMVNAVALPGGRVLLFDGLLAEAESPEEAAAVLGHEIGHVRKRHVMQSLLRQMGLSVLLGGMDGAGGSTVSGLLSLSYSRDAEREADTYSIARMQGARISPEGGAALFDRLAGEDGPEGSARTMIGYISSHPHSDERADAFREAAEGGDYDPALSDTEWRALQEMCAEDPDVAESASIITLPVDEARKGRDDEAEESVASPVPVRDQRAR